MTEPKVKVDRKAIDKMNKIQAKYGGYRPDLINMLFAEKLHCSTIALIILTAILAALTIVHIVMLVMGEL